MGRAIWQASKPVVPLDDLSIQPCLPRQYSNSLLERYSEVQSSDGSPDDTSRILGLAAVRSGRESGRYSRLSSLRRRTCSCLQEAFRCARVRG